MFTNASEGVSEPRGGFDGTLKICLVAGLSVLLCLGSSCEGFFVDPTVTSIAITPATPSIVQSKTQQMTANASYDDGSASDITNRATWSTSDSTKVTVSNTGLVTGISPGSATITATSGMISGSTTVGVTAADLVTIQVSPSSVSALTGQTIPFSATGAFAGGGNADVTDAVVWSTDNSKVTISNSSPTNGQAQILGPFPSFPVRVKITATSGSVSGTATLAVTQ
jgi:Bacterial Ig-like domain (group 2)